MSAQQQIVSSSAPRARRVIDVPVAEEMSESFLAYGLSVITARAIPDVRDGLKPVQRRILWSMLQMGVRPGTPFRKSARIVGDTMGRYHPHGDAAIYDALVRLGQDFSRRVPLVDPQGNFGSLDDPPAAARYTECRMSRAALDVVGEVEEETVDFLPTYDGEGMEPSVLPAAFPNLLVNGTAGIAVGMATNMVPHNLVEVGAAVEAVLRNQERGVDTTVDELLEAVPGPDFPGGGRVIDKGLLRVHRSGRGPVRMRARVAVERVTRSREAIVVSELPYQVGAEKVVARVTKLTEAGRLPSVAGVADLTDTDGLRIRITLKPGSDTRSVLADLYRLTPLEETFHVNNVVLVDGVPTTVGLRELCEHYISHRLEVIVRRTRYRLGKACTRLEIVSGLLIALDAIDEVVTLIRQSKNTAEARQSLMTRLELTELQAVHILDMPLRRLTALERQKLLDEAESLRADIADYERVLASERRRCRMVRDELRRIVRDHGTPRRSEIVTEAACDFGISGLRCSSGAGGDGTVSDGQSERTAGGAGDGAVAGSSGRDVPCVVTVSTSGNLGRAPVDEARRASPGRHDLLAARAVTSTAAPLALVTSEGRVFVVRAGDTPEAGNRVRGAAVAPMLGLAKKEKVLALITDGREQLVVVTASGMVRRLNAGSVLKSGSGDPAIDLRPGDRLAAAFPAADDADLVIVADDAKVLRTPAAAFPSSSMGRDRSGAIGMRLTYGVEVVGAGSVASADMKTGGGLPDGLGHEASVAVGLPGIASVAADRPGSVSAIDQTPGDGLVVVATSTGGLKATLCDELPTRGRGGRGLFVAKLIDGEQIIAVAVVSATNPGFTASGAASGAPADPSAGLGLLALKERDDDSRRIDPRPVMVRVENTRRYSRPTRSGRRVMLLAPARW